MTLVGFHIVACASFSFAKVLVVKCMSFYARLRQFEVSRIDLSAFLGVFGLPQDLVIIPKSFSLSSLTASVMLATV